MKHLSDNVSCTKGTYERMKTPENRLKKNPSHHLNFRQLIVLKLFWLLLVKLCLHAYDQSYKNKIVLL